MEETTFELNDCNYAPVHSQEQPGNNSERRNCRGIAFATVIILVLCSLGGTTFYLFQDKQHVAGSPVSFRDFFFGALQEPPLRYHWLQEDLLAFDDGSMNIGLLRIGKDGKIRNTVESIIEYGSAWIPSFDASYIAYSMGTEELFRHSTMAIYRIIYFENGVLKKLYPVSVTNASDTRQKLRLFKWEPGGTGFAFVYNNDIYYRRAPGEPDAVRITWNGGRDNDDDPDVFSGVADWLYEEEIFHACEAMWWSTNGKYLAYATFNESLVKRATFDYYAEGGEDLYPRRKRVPYPKVGERLPRVTLHVWDKRRDLAMELKPPVEVQQLKEYYLFSVSWPNITIWIDCNIDEPAILAVWSNRAQNLGFITLCSVRTGVCILNYVMNNDSTAENRIWLEPADLSVRYAAGDRYFVLQSSLQEGGYWYMHVASIEIQETGQSRSVKFLTRGMWEVTQIAGYNAEQSILYFIAAYPLPRRKNLFSVSTVSNHSSARCLTCWMEEPMHCTYISVGFSKDGDHYVLSCEGHGLPFTTLRKASTNETLYRFTNNTQFERFVGQKAMPVIKYESIDIGGGYEATARILYPPGYNESHHIQEKFPLVQFVYSGPNSQYVWEQWIGGIGFETYLASSQRYIVVSFDGRGSSNRGTKYKSPIYRRLGGYEVMDQILAARAFIEKSNAVDPDRMAAWGWSYGGFAAISMIEQGAFSLYKCAAAVAPATNFRYYDAAYVERYMGLYDDAGGPEAYARVNLLSNVSQFSHGKFLLIHGTADDNVHYQHSAMLSGALTQHNIQFSYMLYTNGDHSLSSGRLHLYTMLDNFFEDCFKVE